MSEFNNEYGYDEEMDEVDQPLREGQEILPSEEADATMIDNFVDDEGLAEEEEIAVLDEEIEEDELNGDDDMDEEENEGETHKRLRYGTNDDEMPSSSSGIAATSSEPIAHMKKPPSKWLVFLGEQRKVVSEEHPSLSVAQLTKMIADQYKALPPEEHERLDAIVKEQKDKYDEYIQAHPEAARGRGNQKSGNSGVISATELIFPQARVKKAMKCDDEVKTVSKDALLVVTKSLEKFVEALAQKSAAHATNRRTGGRTIQLNDVLKAIHQTGDNPFDFLQYDFPKPMSDIRKPSASSSSASKNFGGNRSSASSGNKKGDVGSSTPGIKSFFVGGKRKSNDDDGAIQQTEEYAMEESEEVATNEENREEEEIEDNI